MSIVQKLGKFEKIKKSCYRFKMLIELGKGAAIYWSIAGYAAICISASYYSQEHFIKSATAICISALLISLNLTRITKKLFPELKEIPFLKIDRYATYIYFERKIEASELKEKDIEEIIKWNEIELEEPKNHSKITSHAITIALITAAVNLIANSSLVKNNAIQIGFTALYFIICITALMLFLQSIFYSSKKQNKKFTNLLKKYLIDKERFNSDILEKV
ncbi:MULTISPECIES: hypothetical protein [Pseudomonas]|uniref:hypothetical protein n=1 Tax=Pseudomonas TaxID=286 RepID=UPI00135E18B9|nr:MULTISPECIES: hypothetical protein [Pseudomonas]MXS19886.1 hypothetical protein [Pseudomonas oryzihabitans]NRH43292.1 hypothetical protein [Pseudomonas sp. MS15a(2019)]